MQTNAPFHLNSFPLMVLSEAIRLITAALKEEAPFQLSLRKCKEFNQVRKSLSKFCGLDVFITLYADKYKR